MLWCDDHAYLPEITFSVDNLWPKNIAANIIVKRGFVKIKVTASPTGMNLTQAKVVSIVKPPRNPTKHVITLS